MSKPENKDRDNADAQDLRAQLAAMKVENERLSQLTRDVAVANVRAAELMVELEELRDELQDRNDQLQSAVIASKAAEEAKACFLANMSHELRTPMNGVIGVAALLMDCELTEEQLDLARTIESSAQILMALVNDILDLSKIEAGKMDLEEADFDLLTTIEEVAEMMRLAALDKGVELMVDIAPGVPAWQRGDVTRLRQVLINLLSNAIKFTSEGEVVIRLSFADESDLGPAYSLSVSDTGIGIPADRLGALFEVFTQVDTSTTRQYGGTGLGLTIARQISELMGGRLEVSSVVGEGSTFVATLPHVIPITLDRDGMCAEPRFDGQDILLVDDNETNRMILQRITSAWNLTPVCAASGEEALRILRAAARAGRPIELAILDVQMPVMDGIELIHQIAQDPAIAGLRSMVLSSVGLAPEQRPVEEWATKPLRRRRLAECLRRLAGHELATPRPQRPVTKSRQVSGHHQPVLLVEDNAVNRKVARMIIERAGLTVEIVTDGQQALDAVKRTDYLCVLMDCEMPIMDGFCATRAIRSWESLGERLPIIAMTAHATTDARRLCLDAGMDDYVTKPVLPDVLLAAIEKWTTSSSH